MPDMKDRRPLASRNTRWAGRIAAALARRGITPNRISQASMVAAAIAGLCFWRAGAADAGIWRSVLLVLAALAIQLRLLCNLFDGMVAVEAGKSTPDGPFWNEFPDRIADLLILVGVGYGVGAPALGWAAGAMAVLTAYVRELGSAKGLDADFAGPMAKQHRMALLTGAALLSLLDGSWFAPGTVLSGALWLVAIGAAATSLRRAWRIRSALLGS